MKRLAALALLVSACGGGITPAYCHRKYVERWPRSEYKFRYCMERSELRRARAGIPPMTAAQTTFVATVGGNTYVCRPTQGGAHNCVPFGR
jgi:hypothetical protein